MHMLDWSRYRQQILAGLGELAKLSPDTVRGYGALGAAGQKTGHLDPKARELISVALAVGLRCDGCITVHTEAARRLGATREEIAEAAQAEAPGSRISGASDVTEWRGKLVDVLEAWEASNTNG
jgi:AhpD family alkylhydroperoxidase